MAARRLEVGVVEVQRGMGAGSGHEAVVKVDLREVLAGEAVLGSELRERVGDFAQGEPSCAWMPAKSAIRVPRSIPGSGCRET